MLGPRTRSSTLTRVLPWRFWNQLLSGTSSSVLMFNAGCCVRSPGFPNVWIRKSYWSLSLCFAMPCTSTAESLSTQTGSSVRNV